jgi:2-polyprenyl-3-methyl-5-hydroxy-6-metoxy-1,4-benzoquinol methylase
LPNLSRRRLQPEVMDQPGLDRGRHFQALRGLERINFWSRSAAILRPSLADLARRGGPVRVLDVATGGGDVPVRLWRWARRAKLPLNFAGCDVSPDAVEYAGGRAAEQGAGVRFFVHDALAGPLPAGYDVLTCSLFLHHLEEGQAVGLLRRMADAAGMLVLVNDLERGPGGLVLAVVGTRLLSRSDVVHVDGPRSVEGAFTVDEARRLAEAAGLTGATVRRRWPFRYLLSWARP